MTRLEDPMAGATHTDVGGVSVDEVAAGRARVKRLVYPPGWRWSAQMAPVTVTERCQHAHVGFVAQGSSSSTHRQPWSSSPITTGG
jgi:hypothetical protein